MLGFEFTAAASSGQLPVHPTLKIFINEVEPGVMSSPQYCTLVFADHHFHSEQADIRQGERTDRKVYEGQLSENDWNDLVAIIDSEAFRDLKVPRTVPPLVMQDTHPYTISVARDDNFQNMEFLDQKSLKPYEAQIKPLLHWWKSLRKRHTPESSAPPDPRCKLDSAHVVFAQ